MSNPFEAAIHALHLHKIDTLNDCETYLVIQGELAKVAKSYGDAINVLEAAATVDAMKALNWPDCFDCSFAKTSQEIRRPVANLLRAIRDSQEAGAKL
jgi:hypothetical protein